MHIKGYLADKKTLQRGILNYAYAYDVPRVEAFSCNRGIHAQGFCRTPQPSYAGGLFVSKSPIVF